MEEFICNIRGGIQLDIRGNSAETSGGIQLRYQGDLVEITWGKQLKYPAKSS